MIQDAANTDSLIPTKVVEDLWRRNETSQGYSVNTAKPKAVSHSIDQSPRPELYSETQEYKCTQRMC